MDRQAFKQRMKQLKLYRELNPDKTYLDFMEQLAEFKSKEWNEDTDLVLTQMLNDNTYNYKQMYNENPQMSPSEGHFTDTYKTVYHPTFSEESMYSGKKSQYNPDGIVGGSWDYDNKVFKAGKQLDIKYAQDYLNSADPGWKASYAEGGEIPPTNKPIIPEDPQPYKGKLYKDRYGKKYTEDQLLEYYDNSTDEVDKFTGKPLVRGLKPVGDIEDAANATPIGDVISAYDAYSSARQGDWVGAGLSTLAMLPFVPMSVKEYRRKYKGITRKVKSKNKLDSNNTGTYTKVNTSAKPFNTTVNKDKTQLLIDLVTNKYTINNAMLAKASNQGYKIAERLMDDPEYLDRALLVKKKFGDDYTTVYADIIDAYNNNPNSYLPVVDVYNNPRSSVNGSMRNLGHGNYNYTVNADMADLSANLTEHEWSHYADFKRNLDRPDAHGDSNMFYLMSKDLDNKKIDNRDSYYQMPTELKAHMNQLREYMFQNGYITKRGETIESKMMKNVLDDIRNIPSMKGVFRASQLFKNINKYTKWFNSIPLLGVGAAAVYNNSQQNTPEFDEGGQLVGLYSNHTGIPTMYIPVTEDTDQGLSIANAHLPEVTITANMPKTDALRMYEADQLAGILGTNTLSKAEELAEWTSYGDFKDLVRLGLDIKDQNYLNAGVSAGLLALPNVIEKPIKKVVRKVKQFNRHRKWDRYSSLIKEVISDDHRNRVVNSYMDKTGIEPKVIQEREYKMAKERSRSEYAKLLNLNIINQLITPQLYISEHNLDDNREYLTKLFLDDPRYFDFILSTNLDPLDLNTVNKFIDKLFTGIRGVSFNEADDALVERALTTTDYHSKGGDRLGTKNRGVYVSNSGEIADRFSRPLHGNEARSDIGLVKYNVNVDNTLPIDQLLALARRKIYPHDAIYYNIDKDMLADLGYVAKESQYTTRKGNRLPGYERAYFDKADGLKILEVKDLTTKYNLENKNGRWALDGVSSQPELEAMLFEGNNIGTSFGDFMRFMRTITPEHFTIPNPEFSHVKLKYTNKFWLNTEAKLRKMIDLYDEFKRKTTLSDGAKASLGALGVVGAAAGAVLFSKQKSNKKNEEKVREIEERKKNKNKSNLKK